MEEHVELSEEQLKRARRIAGGSESAPKSVREAAIRLITGFNDEYDYKILIDYIEN